VVNTARAFGLSDYALEMTVRVLVMELIPLLTAFFVALRSGAAINTEVALMHIHNELTALEHNGVDPMRFELIPRIIGSSVSVLALTAVSISVALMMAFVLVYGLQPGALADFAQVMARVFAPLTVLGLWLKVFLFGLAVAVIPISAGISVPKKLFFAPISVLQGMVRLFFFLMLVEVGSLALRYI
jgi:phospholipid/cholesterol/gamma-HCH transport system permease protein